MTLLCIPLTSCLLFAGGDKDPAEIQAEDQGGQEFDTDVQDEGRYEAEDSSKKGSKQEAKEAEDAAAEDQGGQEFEPLPVKRILVDN